MMKFVTALMSVLVVALALAGSTTAASAHHRYHHHSGCCGGGSTSSYVYSTTHRIHNVTRYRDVQRTRYVHRLHRIIHITRVQPIVYVHSVTRVHHRTISVLRSVHQRMTEYLPARVYVSHRVFNTYDCVCRGRSRRCR